MKLLGGSDTATDNDLADFVSEFYADPLGFVMHAFEWGVGDLVGRDGPDTWQRELLIEWGEAIRKNAFNGVNAVPPVRFAVASGHGVGKSAVTAWINLFIMSTRPHARGVVTANTGDQLRTKTWAELAKWKALCITGHWFELNSGKGSLSMYHRDHSETWRVDALTSTKENSEAFAGLHNASSSAYYLFDEASKIDDQIWEVAEGGLTDGEPFFFAFGNPTRNKGKFKQLFASNSRWRYRHVDARTCKMPDHRLHDEWIADYGIDSDFVRVRVLGLFPNADDTQFISNALALDAMRRPLPPYTGYEPLIMGVDVARGGGDQCVVQFRRGRDARSEKVYMIAGEKARDSMKFVGILVNIINDHRPDVIFVDETGVGGPVKDRLAQLGHNAIGVHFGGKADNDKLYANKVSEMFMRLREWLQEGGCLPKHPTLETELTTRGFDHDKKDRLLIESKDHMKEELGYSPDWCDALLLTFAYKVAQLTQARGVRDNAPGNRVPAHAQRRGDYDPLAGYKSGIEED